MGGAVVGVAVARVCGSCKAENNTDINPAQAEAEDRKKQKQKLQFVFHNSFDFDDLMCSYFWNEGLLGTFETVTES